MEQLSYNSSQNQKKLIHGKFALIAAYSLVSVAFIFTVFAVQKIYSSHFSESAKQASFVSTADADTAGIVAKADTGSSGGDAGTSGEAEESSDNSDGSDSSGDTVIGQDNDEPEDNNNSGDEQDDTPPQQNGSDNNSGTGEGGGSTVTPPVNATKPNSPAAPYLTPVSASEISVSWGTVTGATQYKVSYSTTATFAGASTVTSGINSARITGLTAKTTYYVRLQAINSIGISEYSGTKSAVTLQYVPPAPAIPSGLSVNTPTPNGFSVVWNTSSLATHYIVRVSTSSQFTGSTIEYAPTKSNRYVIANLKTGVMYYIQVRASNNGTLSSWSANIAYGTKYTYPSTLSLSAVSSSQINVSWAAVSSVTTYAVRYATSSTMTGARTLSTSSTSTSLTNLSPSTTYYVQVNAGAAPRTSDWKKQVSLTTKSRFDIRVGTFNIASSALDDRFQTDKKWSTRKSLVVKTIQNNNFDIIGLQEVTTKQHEDLANSLSEYSATKSYGTWLGDSAIFYKKAALTIAEQGRFKISDAWPKVKNGTYASSARYGEWALFKHNASGKYFYVFNTHPESQHKDDIDTARFIAANKSGAVKLVAGIDKINSKGRSVLLTGDFNSVSKEDGSSYSTITKAGFADSLEKTPANARVNANYNSFNGFKTPGKNGWQIDKVYFKGDITPLNAKLITDTFNGLFASDHFAYITTVKIEI